MSKALQLAVSLWLSRPPWVRPRAGKAAGSAHYKAAILAVTVRWHQPARMFMPGTRVTVTNGGTVCLASNRFAGLVSVRRSVCGTRDVLATDEPRAGSELLPRQTSVIGCSACALFTFSSTLSYTQHTHDSQTLRRPSCFSQHPAIFSLSLSLSLSTLVFLVEQANSSPPAALSAASA